MVLYDILAILEDVKIKKDDLSKMNENLGYACGLNDNISVCIYGGKENKISIVIGCKMEKVTMENIKEYLQKFIVDYTHAKSVTIKIKKELKARELASYERKADSAGICSYSGRLTYEIGLHYFDNYSFKARELCYSNTFTYHQAMKAAEEIMADDSFLEEIDRIYSEENEKRFLGHPVHYKIAAGETKAAQAMVDVLVPALYSNKRLLGRRVTWISNINAQCEEEEDIKNIIMNSQGETVVIETAADDGESRRFASAYEKVSRFFSDLIDEYKLNTLVIFVENVNAPGFSKSLLAHLRDSIDVVELLDGRGDTQKARDYFLMLSKDAEYKATKEEVNKLIPSRKSYTASEVCGIYKKWYGNALKYKVYRSYVDCTMAEIEPSKRCSDPYKTLQKMVGLTEIKEIVDEIIDTYKAEKLRSRYGITTVNQSKHMIFTGNPGSAKTTVARLLADILKREKVLESGAFVECGRADLVGKYVGWTAKIVSEKFYKARGGVLFIDEAYSLVSDDGYGDEAINTIVQEMENHREDVIVIFAGYPEKMKAFIDKNEGLRSRIAFHLNFPDYKPDEMMGILNNMAKEREFKLAKGVEEKCMEIFTEACKHEEFGNGRYARNLLEQAIMHQSKRVIAESRGREITKRALTTLKPTDFEVNASNRFKEKKMALGFGT